MAEYDKIDDDMLVNMVHEEVAAADYSGTNELSFQREQSTRAYNGVLTDGLQPTTGMSSIVNNKIQPCVETLTTYLTKIFCSDKETVVFTPTNPDLAHVADQTSMVINHVLHKQNRGYEVINRWIKDAAINKNGIVKVTWCQEEEGFKEEFEGSEQEINIAVAEREAQGWDAEKVGKPEKVKTVLEITDENTDEILEVTEEHIRCVYKFTRMKGYPRIENVPPEEFLINERTTNINGDPKTRFACQRQTMPVSNLIAMAQEMDLDFSEDDLLEAGAAGYLEYEYERLNRHAFDGTYDYTGTDPSSGVLREVEVIEAWIRADTDGDGIAEMRHVMVVGKLVLFNEEWFGDIPFASFTFFPIPHKFYGLSVYDKLQWYHRACSMLLRSEVDSRLQQNTFRLIADPKQIDIRDLTSGRPGIIKAKPGFDPKSVMPIQTGATSGNTGQLLEYLHREIVGQIGIDPNTGAISSDVEKSGNDAAKTSQVIDNASAKIEQFAREFAETGLRDAIWQIAKLLMEHSDEDSVNRLVEKITPGTPFMLAAEGVSEYFDRDDLTAKVGLGHQTSQQKLAGAQAIMQAQQAMEASPVAPVSIPAEHKLNAAKELAKGLGYEDVNKFFPTPEEVQQAAQAQAQQAAALQQRDQNLQAAQMQDGLDNSEAKRRLEDAKAKEAEIKSAAAERMQQLMEEKAVIDIDNVTFDNELNERRQAAQEEQMAENIDLRKANEELQRELALLKSETQIEVAEIQADAKIKDDRDGA